MIEKTIDFIRIILLLGLVYFVWAQGQTIQQLEERIIVLQDQTDVLTDNIVNDDGYMQRAEAVERTEMLLHDFIASALEQMMGEVIEDKNTQN
tara:strand:- start:2008 stop:2286 length:279 start_codon:yes stop_codon:yes gene_type:complete